MKHEDDKLVDLATSIADGRSIDWESTSVRQEKDSTTVKNLKVLDTIIRSHHRLQHGSEELTSWGPLQIIRPLASGTYGEVFRAYDPALDRDVALKLLRQDKAMTKDKAASQDNCLRLLHEGRHLARVQHENVATIYGAQEYDGRVGIWMELIEGDSLDRLYHLRKTTASSDEALIVANTMCRALSAVHAAGRAHGDIKTQNIMREVGGRLVLTDFGSGSCLGAGDSLVSGTPLYMAPEVLAGNAPTVASDIYSVGVLLFHLITGRFPFEAETLNKLKEAHFAGHSNALQDLQPQLAPEVVALIEKAIQSPPENRYETAGEMAKAIQNCLGDKQSVAPFTRKKMFGALAAIGLVVALTAVFVIGQLASPTLQVESTMYRSNDQGQVAVTSGASVSRHDRLYLEIESTTELHFYVLNQDDRGEAWILFPLQGQGLRNPLAAGQQHRLPGELNGVPYSWEVTSMGGVEHFLVIGSREPLVELEATIARLSAAAGQNGALSVDAKAKEVFRGVSGLTEEPSYLQRASGDFLGNIEDIIRAKEESGSAEFWSWRIDLVNSIVDDSLR